MLSLELEADDGTPLAQRASGAIRHAQARARRRRASTRAQLLAVRAAGRHSLPDHGQGRTARSGRPDTCAPRSTSATASRSRHRADSSRSMTAHAARRAGERGRRRDTRARDAARAPRQPVDAGRSGGSTAHATAPSTPSPRRHGRCSPTLPNARSRVWYSRPGPDDHLGTDYDELGHITAEGIAAAGAPTDGEFYLCGPAPFMTAIRCRPRHASACRPPACTPRRSARRLRSRPASSRTPPGHHTRPKAPPAPARSCPSCGPA